MANEGTFASWTILLLCFMIKVKQLGQYKNRLRLGTDKMDATIQTVLRLHEQGIPRRTIAKRAGISLQKVRKILITAGAWSDETSEKIGKLRANGMSVPEIAEELGVKTNTVWSYLPYSKGMYNQEYPTINAIRVRNSKRKAKEKALTCTDTAQNEGSGAC